MNSWDLKAYLLQRIAARGGWVNAHAHLDRAYTLTSKNFSLSQKLRHEKWVLNNSLKERSTVSQIYDRMARALEHLLDQGVQAVGTFIDVDYLVKDKAIQAAQKLKHRYGSKTTLKFLNQSSYGLFDTKKKTPYWFNLATDFVDIIGGLLKVDAHRASEHLDILLSTAKAKKKMLHVHIDELNTPDEKETELLARKTIAHGMHGQVVGIHAISLNAHPKAYRQKAYRLAKKAGLMFISCPVSWLNARRSETLTPTHNPITPVDEMLPHKLTVALGTDNINDIWMPFNNADMWLDLRILLEAARVYDLEKLVDIATVNGKKVLGLER